MKKQNEEKKEKTNIRMEDLLFGKRSGEGKIKKTTTTAISNKVGKSEEQIKQEQKKIKIKQLAREGRSGREK